MPGSRRNPAAAGTNALIADGAHPLLEPSDVLLAIGLTPGSRRAQLPPPARGSDAARVLGACGGEPATFDQLASRTALGPDQVAVAVRELERGGLDGTRAGPLLAKGVTVRAMPLPVRPQPVGGGGDVELFGELHHVRDLVDVVLVDRLVGAGRSARGGSSGRHRGSGDTGSRRSRSTPSSMRLTSGRIHCT